jgi:hypothetical protein
MARATVEEEAEHGECHDNPVKAGGGVTFELAHGSLSVSCNSVMEDFCDCRIHTFTAFFSELAGMETFGVNSIMDSPPPKDKANKQVKVSFKEVKDSKLLQLQVAGFLGYHYINDIGPAS